MSAPVSPCRKTCSCPRPIFSSKPRDFRALLSRPKVTRLVPTLYHPLHLIQNILFTIPHVPYCLTREPLVFGDMYCHRLGTGPRPPRRILLEIPLHVQPVRPLTL